MKKTCPLLTKSKSLGQKVTIVLPTYNRARFLRQAIDSCVNQSYTNIEVNIVDDGSTDNTADIVRSYKDGRVHYFRHRKNRGLPESLNTGFSHATGAFVTFTSDDNWYAPTAIEEMLGFIKTSGVDFVYCDFFLVSDQPYSEKLIRLPSLPIDGEHCLNNVGACFLFTRHVLESIGRFDPDAFLCEDYDYWIRVSKRFEMRHLPRPLYFYRAHPASVSSSNAIEQRVVGVLVGIKNGVFPIAHAERLMDEINAQSRTSRLLGSRSQSTATKSIYGKSIYRKSIYSKTFDLNRLAVKLLTPPTRKVMADLASGKLSLKSARSILCSVAQGQYDGRALRTLLSLEHFLSSRLNNRQTFS